MGTHGLVVVSSESIITRNTLILGVTSDGFSDTLVSLAKQITATAKRMRVLTLFRKGHQDTIKLVMQRVCQDNKNWCFVDTYGNAEWISYSVVLNPKFGTILSYEGNLKTCLSRQAA